MPNHRIAGSFLRWVSKVRQRFRQWRYQSREYLSQRWQRKLRQPTLRFIRAWPAWALPILVAVGYFLTRHLISKKSISEFDRNVVAEAMGLLVAFSLAWWFIERPRQNQQRKVEEAVQEELMKVRRTAALVITHYTTRVWNQPDFHTSQDGIWYLEQNYQALRGLLEGKLPIYMAPQSIRGYDLPEEPERDPNNWAWILRQMDGLSSEISRTLEYLGPAMMEHSELRRALRRFRERISAELEEWSRYRELRAAQERARHGRIADLITQRRSDEIPGLTRDLLPPEALSNFHALILYAWAIVAAITRIYKDWKHVPPGEHANAYRIFWGRWADLSTKQG